MLQKVGGTKHILSSQFQKVGGTCPSVHPTIYAHELRLIDQLSGPRVIIIYFSKTFNNRRTCRPKLLTLHSIWCHSKLS